jgi:hypothetical protein
VIQIHELCRFGSAVRLGIGGGAWPTTATATILYVCCAARAIAPKTINCTTTLYIRTYRQGATLGFVTLTLAHATHTHGTLCQTGGRWLLAGVVRWSVGAHSGTVQLRSTPSTRLRLGARVLCVVVVVLSAPAGLAVGSDCAPPSCSRAPRASALTAQQMSPARDLSSQPQPQPALASHHQSSLVAGP